MKASFDHVQYNSANTAATAAFWRDLLGYFEMQTLVDADWGLGISDGHVGFWVMPPTNEESKAHVYNRDGTGLNHVGLKVASREDVDQFLREFLQPKGIAPQFGTPRARTDFGPTYYQVMFVDPEGLAIEVFCS